MTTLTSMDLVVFFLGLIALLQFVRVVMEMTSDKLLNLLVALGLATIAVLITMASINNGMLR